MQAVKAYYDEGKFVPVKPIKLPKGSSAVITIFDFPMAEDTMHESRAEWLNRLREARELARDEDLPDWPFQRSKEMRPPINLAD